MASRSRTWRRRAARCLGPRWTLRARCLLRGKPLPFWGNLRRTTPLSEEFGFDRGSPIDRYYVDRFFTRHRSRIAGRVLEIQGRGYTQRFAQDLSASDTLDVNAQFAPTYLCDLACAEAIVPSGTYDCFLLPNTAQHLRELEPALRNALRIVRPGGSLLLTAAGLIPLIPDGPEYCRLTAEGWRDFAARVWPGCDVEVVAYGNCLAAVAALYGIAVEELRDDELDVQDPRYPVLIGVACRKPLEDRAEPAP